MISTIKLNQLGEIVGSAPIDHNAIKINDFVVKPLPRFEFPHIPVRHFSTRQGRNHSLLAHKLVDLREYGRHWPNVDEFERLGNKHGHAAVSRAPKSQATFVSAQP